MCPDLGLFYPTEPPGQAYFLEVQSLGLITSPALHPQYQFLMNKALEDVLTWLYLNLLTWKWGINIIYKNGVRIY